MRQMMDIETQVQQLDNMTVSGQIMEALDKFYHPDLITREGNKDQVKGKEAHRQKLESFFEDITKVNDISLHSYAVGQDVSMSEFTFDLQKKDGSRILWNEILRRKWNDGQVIDERYYTAE